LIAGREGEQDGVGFGFVKVIGQDEGVVDGVAVVYKLMEVGGSNRRGQR
jgi:hypothetical protein